MSQPTVALGALMLTVGVADSLNPSTVAPASVLAIREDGAIRAAAFAAGVGVVSLLGGVLLVVGPGEALIAAIPHPSAPVRRIGEAVIGVLLLALAAGAWVGRHRIARRMTAPSEPRASGSGRASAFALGAGIMAVELPTAVPYIGAIAAVIGSRGSLISQLLLVVAYNIAFVLPLAAIVIVRIVAGDRAATRLTILRARIGRHMGAALAALLGAAGLALLVWDVSKL